MPLYFTFLQRMQTTTKIPPLLVIRNPTANHDLCNEYRVNDRNVKHTPTLFAIWYIRICRI